jgi:hypothetical protein
MNQSVWIAQQVTRDHAMNRLSEAAAWRLAADARRHRREPGQRSTAGWRPLLPRKLSRLARP